MIMVVGENRRRNITVPVVIVLEISWRYLVLLLHSALSYWAVKCFHVSQAEQRKIKFITKGFVCFLPPIYDWIPKLNSRESPLWWYTKNNANIVKNVEEERDKRPPYDLYVIMHIILGRRSLPLAAGLHRERATTMGRCGTGGDGIFEFSQSRFFYEWWRWWLLSLVWWATAAAVAPWYGDPAVKFNWNRRSKGEIRMWRRLVEELLHVRCWWMAGWGSSWE